MPRPGGSATEEDAGPRRTRAKGASALVVVNPLARRHPPEKVLEALEAAFKLAGLEYRIVPLPEREARPAILGEVKRALAEGCDRVVAVGGDGTVSLAAEGLIRSRERYTTAALGIIPTGTANVLAKELGIPGALDGAVEIAAGSDRTLTLDAIAVADRFCLTQVGIGPDACMIQNTSRESQLKLGRVAYAINYIKESLRQRSRRFTIDLDGSPVRAHAWQIILANVGSLGAPPFTWGPHIDPTDGVLNLCIYDVRTLKDYARLVWRLFFARHQKDANTRYLRVRESVSIRSNRPILVQGDGEVLGETPITARAACQVLRVLVRREVEVPPEPAAPPAAVSGVGTGAAPGESVVREVETMLATEHSRTWVLQGWLKHPVAAFQAFDAAVFLRANALSLGSPADRVVRILSSTMRYGEGWALVLLVLIAVDFRTGLRAAVEAAPVIWLTMLTVNLLVKRIFRRRRPFISYVKARVLGTRPKDFSFPSGHAAAGFAGAVALSTHAPAFAPLFYALAMIVGLSRVYLGVHYPSDVLFGAILGAFLAALYRTVLQAIFPGVLWP